MSFILKSCVFKWNRLLLIFILIWKQKYLTIALPCDPGRQWWKERERWKISSKLQRYSRFLIVFIALTCHLVKMMSFTLWLPYSWILLRFNLINGFVQLLQDQQNAWFWLQRKSAEVRAQRVQLKRIEDLSTQLEERLILDNRSMSHSLHKSSDDLKTRQTANVCL